VRYDLKKPFAVLSEIKLKGVSEKLVPPSGRS
jgi:hypothetical protein